MKLNIKRVLAIYRSSIMPFIFDHKREYTAVINMIQIFTTQVEGCYIIKNGST